MDSADRLGRLSLHAAQVSAETNARLVDLCASDLEFCRTMCKVASTSEGTARGRPMAIAGRLVTAVENLLPSLSLSSVQARVLRREIEGMRRLVTALSHDAGQREPQRAQAGEAPAAPPAGLLAFCAAEFDRCRYMLAALPTLTEPGLRDHTLDTALQSYRSAMSILSRQVLRGPDVDRFETIVQEVRALLLLHGSRFD